jgi:hypothetical protein
MFPLATAVDLDARVAAFWSIGGCVWMYLVKNG